MSYLRVLLALVAASSLNSVLVVGAVAAAGFLLGFSLSLPTATSLVIALAVGQFLLAVVALSAIETALRLSRPR